MKRIKWPKCILPHPTAKAKLWTIVHNWSLVFFNERNDLRSKTNWKQESCLSCELTSTNFVIKSLVLCTHMFLRQKHEYWSYYWIICDEKLTFISYTSEIIFSACVTMTIRGSGFFFNSLIMKFHFFVISLFNAIRSFPSNLRRKIPLSTGLYCI